MCNDKCGVVRGSSHSDLDRLARRITDREKRAVTVPRADRRNDLAPLRRTRIRFLSPHIVQNGGLSSTPHQNRMKILKMPF